MERCVPFLALYAEPERWPNGFTNRETAMNVNEMSIDQLRAELEAWLASKEFSNERIDAVIAEMYDRIVIGG